MQQHEHHEELLQTLSQQLQEIFEGSTQAVYLFLDDEHKACNQKFADLLGYESPEAWAAVTEPFPQEFVAQVSQHALVNAFQAAMQDKVGATLPVTWKKKDGSAVNTTVILVPISFEGHLIALHFVEVVR